MTHLLRGMKSAESPPSRTALDLVEKLSAPQLSAMVPVLEALYEFVSRAPAEPPPLPIAQPVIGSVVHVAPHHNLLEKLRLVEAKLQEAISMEPTPAREEQFANCLAMLQSETARLDEEYSSSPHADLSSSPGPGLLSSPSMFSVDAITGLPTRPVFERLVTTALEGHRTIGIALFVIERLAYVNKRFGKKASDEVLLFVAQHLAAELADTNSFSRWSGPAFVAIFDLSKDHEGTERKLQSIVAKQLSKNLSAGGRSVILPISCSYLLERLSPEQSPSDIYAKMDDFIANHLRE